MSAPTIGVLAVQGDVREHTVALGACGAQVRSVRTAVELAGLDGLVIPGGESSTIGKLATDLGLLEPIRLASGQGLPIYGSCAGMVLVAREILAGVVNQPTVGCLDITVRRNAFGRQVASFEQDLHIPRIGERRFHGIFIRAPWVESIGDDVEVLAQIPDELDGAGTKADAGRIVAVKQGNTMATAFHPELTDDRRIHALFVDIVKGQA